MRGTWMCVPNENLDVDLLIWVKVTWQKKKKMHCLQQIQFICYLSECCHVFQPLHWIQYGMLWFNTTYHVYSVWLQEMQGGIFRLQVSEDWCQHFSDMQTNRRHKEERQIECQTDGCQSVAGRKASRGLSLNALLLAKFCADTKCVDAYAWWRPII